MSLLSPTRYPSQRSVLRKANILIALLVTFCVLGIGTATAQEGGPGGGQAQGTDNQPEAEIVNVEDPNTTANVEDLQGDAAESNTFQVPVNDYGMLYVPGFLDGPATTDFGYRMLRMLLGDVVPKTLETSFDTQDPSYDSGSISINDEEGVVTPLLYSVALMAYVALIVGALFIGYFLVAGMFNAGTEGSFLGRKWTPVVPLRIGMGLAGAMPLPGFGGMAAIQGVVLSVILLGIGAASSFFAIEVKYRLSQPPIWGETENYYDFGKNLARSAYCYEIRRLAGLEPEGEPAIKEITARLGSSSSGRGGSNQVAVGYEIGEDGVCGTVNTLTLGDYQRGTGELLKISGDDSPSEARAATVYMKNKIHQEFPEFWSNIVAVTDPIVERVKNNDPVASPDDGDPVFYQDSEVDALFEVITKWRDTVVTGPDGLVGYLKDVRQRDGSQAQSLIETAEKYGFLMAGSMYWSIKQQQDVYYDALSGSEPVYESPNAASAGSTSTSWIKTTWKWITNDDSDGFRQVYDRAEGVFEMQTQDLYSRGFPGFAGDIKINTNGGLSQLGGAITTTIAKSFVSIPRMLGGGSWSRPDPMSEIPAMGNAIINASMAGYMWANLSYAGAQGLEGAAMGPLKSIPKFLSALAKGAKDLMTLALVPLLMIGMLYAWLIPAMPYMMFTIGALGLFIYYIEALYAAPFWSVFHGHPDGHDLVGKGADGYPILMTLCIRPILMIAGLMTGSALVLVFGWFVNITLFPAMTAAIGGSPLSFIGVVLIYGLVMLLVVYKSYSLVYELPTSILRWLGIGTHHADLGESAAEQKMMVVAGGLSTAAAGASGLVGGGGDDPDPGPGPGGGGSGAAANAIKSTTGAADETLNNARGSSDAANREMDNTGGSTLDDQWNESGKGS